jgi:outer membrane protein Omp28/flagellar hook capping protein FlgD
MKFFTVILLTLLIVFSVFGQTQRNPVIELCTGTWCQWCPCGHDVVKNDILINIPNAIILEYHGPANGSDPFSFFSGNTIISSLGLTGYPTGCIDRISGIQSRGTWLSQVNSRNSIPATVAISMQRNFNTTTRDFTASIDFTALQALNGQFKFNVILVEDGMVWGQTSNTTCTPGSTFLPNYIHQFVVRDMMNGPLGVEIVNGSWAQGQVINRNVSYTVPVPSGSGPDVVFDSCRVVVLVYEVGSPLNSGAEIQQAIQDVLISPDYVANISPITPDVIAENTTPATFDVQIYNEGLMEDTYGINLNFNGPAGWSQEYTTVNGTFSAGHVDSVQVTSGDTTTITVSINPNGYDGFGATDLEFLSGNNPSNGGSALLRNVTLTGIDLLVVDAEESDLETYICNSLDNVYSGVYGVVSRTALGDTSLDLSNFDIITWSAGESQRAFYSEEVYLLESYLDNGGKLFITGQDIGSDIFEPTGQSQFAQSFYNNYLHADYINNSITSYLIKGINGDPITDGIQFVITNIANSSFDQIAPYDAESSSIMYYLFPSNNAAIKTSATNYRAVYLGFGFERIPDVANRDTLMARSIKWLNTDLTGIEPENKVPLEFALEQNYPNPFNPGTYIKYTIAEQSNVQLIIYNILGQEIRTLVNNLTQSVNQYSVYWDGRDNSGNQVTSGVYYYKLISNNGNQRFEQSRKMLLIK